jgi:hypothetical protein
MRFGRWHRLEEAAAQAPAGPAVFQVKLASGLVSYPTGKSAMIHYGASPDPSRAVAEIAAAHPGREWMCRFSEDMSPREQADPGGIVAGLLESFRRRFGSPPRIPDS